MNSSKIKLMSVCMTAAIIAALLVGCADPSKNSDTKEPVGTKPTAVTTAVTTEADTTAEEKLPTEEEILENTDENGIAVIDNAAYIAAASNVDLWKYAEAIQTNYVKYYEISKLVIGDTEIDVDFAPVEDNFEFDNVPLLMTAVRALGYEKVFDEPEYMYGNLSVNLYTSDDVIILQKSYYGSGIKLIFSQNGIEEIDDSFEALSDVEDAYAYPIISFDLREDGKIGYTRQPKKYIAIQDVSGVLAYCVSRDELYRETGYVSFNNGKPEYHSETKQTISEAYDLNEYFDAWVSYSENSESDIKTLDQLLEYNSQHYKKAE